MHRTLRRPRVRPRTDVPSAQDEVVEICRELIRIDSSNYGDDSGPGERAAAEYVAGQLAEVGLEPELFESADRRTSLVVRFEGEDSSRPGLLVHGHLDVVPAEAADWTHDPFAGEVVDDCVWGRGAVDMKDMDAMVLALVRQMRREGRTTAAGPGALLPRRRGGRRQARARTGWSTTTPTSSKGSARRSARSAASRSPPATSGST